MMIFNEKLQKLRKSNGLSQEQLAEKLGVSRQAISKWEIGTLPDVDNIVRISRYFDCSLDYLLNNDNDGTEQKKEEGQSPMIVVSGGTSKKDARIYVSALMICIGVVIDCMLPLFAKMYQAFEKNTYNEFFTDASYYVFHSPLIGVVFSSVLLIGFGAITLYRLLRKQR